MHAVRLVAFGFASTVISRNFRFSDGAECKREGNDVAIAEIIPGFAVDVSRWTCHQHWDRRDSAWCSLRAPEKYLKAGLSLLVAGIRCHAFQ